ncbi:uncharacterized protein PAC_16846 [Phialocephala subalpina]|uniref:Uncharacterized protein n=1 Tax=Phialocephala subalpina TaxID=576137 RepID=A0A1L7XPT1_9HELO|nr:uncharacterized protein PAC_16846 [Phialocephala subalpina]
MLLTDITHQTTISYIGFSRWAMIKEAPVLPCRALEERRWYLTGGLPHCLGTAPPLGSGPTASKLRPDNFKFASLKLFKHTLVNNNGSEQAPSNPTSPPPAALNPTGSGLVGQVTNLETRSQVKALSPACETEPIVFEPDSEIFEGYHEVSRAEALQWAGIHCSLQAPAFTLGPHKGSGSLRPQRAEKHKLLAPENMGASLQWVPACGSHEAFEIQ